MVDKVKQFLKVRLYWLLCCMEVLSLAFLVSLIWSLMHCDSIACASSTEHLDWDHYTQTGGWILLAWGSVPVVAIVIFHATVTHRLIRTHSRSDRSVEMTDTNTQKDKKWGHPSVLWLKNNIVGLSFLVICVGGGYLLHSQSKWESSDAKPRPFHFSVLIYNKTNDVLYKNVYPLLNEYKNFEEKEIDGTYLIPAAKIGYPFQDTDTFFSVEQLSPEEQMITLDYEIGLFNHGSSTYRAREKSVEPISTEEGGGITYAISFTAWLLFLTLYAVVRVTLYLVAAIKAR